MQKDDQITFKTLDDMIVGVKYGSKYGSKYNYVFKKNHDIIVIDHYFREYWYDHRHTERIHYEFEISKEDKTLLKLRYLKMASDDLYGYLPLSTLEYNKYDKDNKDDNNEYLFRHYFKDNQFNIQFEDKEKGKEYIKKCIKQTLNFIGKIDLTMINNNHHKRQRIE